MWGVSHSVMRRLAVVILFFVALVSVSCGQPRGSVVRGVEVASVEWGEGHEGGVPERVVLAVDIENRGTAAILRKGRVRIGYAGRRVLMFTLDERVKIPRKATSRVLVPLRVNMARNSQALAFSGALLRHDAAKMEIDWEVVGRAGVVGARIVQPTEPLVEVLTEPMLATLWQITDKIKEKDTL